MATVSDFLREQLSQVMGEDAVNFCCNLYDFYQIWDDIYDGDPVSGDEIIEAFQYALFGLKQEPFYQAYCTLLEPLILSSIQQWQASNVLDKGTNTDRQKSYMLRAGIFHIFVMCAHLCGKGNKSPDIYRMYSEAFESLNEEMNNA